MENFKPLQRRDEITAWVELSPQPGCFDDLPDDLSSSLRQALVKRDIQQLYSHQAEACAPARQGKHLVITTTTTSGKIVCYNLPILADLIQNPHSRALYLFPTKALTQDQMAELQEFISVVAQSISAQTYDGDTPTDKRRKIRKQARIILTNPDMLHCTLLPHHPKWIDIFLNLNYVVVDKLHTYRGIFGSHVDNIFRRLKRIARFYNSRIQFICASAAIVNPGELTKKLVDKTVQQIEQSGTPRSHKELIFYNPPLVHPELGFCCSALSTALFFAEQFLKNHQTLLVRQQSRERRGFAELFKEGLEQTPAEPEKVRGYRGGYLPRTRREVKRQLRDKKIVGVVSTNTLALGIDIGSLEACVLVGYPGSVSSTWQQIGRAVRTNGHSVTILIARNLPLDQFMINHLQYSLGSPPEHGLIHPDNLQILISHVKCVVFELFFQDGEVFGNESVEEILDFLAEQDMQCKPQRVGTGLTKPILQIR